MIGGPSIEANDPAELTPALAERLEVERRSAWNDPTILVAGWAASSAR